MDGTKPITPRERELLGMASIASQLPVEFATGACWLAFTADCKLCDRPIPPELLRGVVSRPMPSVATLEAVGVCPACRVATPFLYRMHDDGRYRRDADDQGCDRQVRGSCVLPAKQNVFQVHDLLLVQGVHDREVVDDALVDQIQHPFPASLGQHLAQRAPVVVAHGFDPA